MFYKHEIQWGYEPWWESPFDMVCLWILQILLVAAGLVHMCTQAYTREAPSQHTHLSTKHTHVQNVHVCVCVSPLRDVELCYSSSVFSAVMLRSYCSLAMLNCPGTTQTHTGCQLAPSDMEKQWWKGETGYCRDSAREETGSEAGTSRIQSKILKKKE